MSVHGWIVLDKPLGLGSTQAVSAVKRALRQGGHGKAKVGHGGTLDPLATGVLPIALGEATKLAGRMLDATKTYDFTVQFGRQTDTLDREGQVIATSPVQPEPGAVARVVAERFTGVIEQVPPAYSAILIDGRRAYDRARDGEDIDMPTRTVTILHWGAIHEAQVDDERTATLTVTVSKGTYVRSLARDIALAHHEKYDGQGYPHGLAGHEIPLSARIMALADVYDALTSRRVYKEAYSHEKTKSMITAAAGRHFDPAMVEAFLVQEQEFIAIRANYAETGDKKLVEETPATAVVEK